MIHTDSRGDGWETRETAGRHGRRLRDTGDWRDGWETRDTAERHGLNTGDIREIRQTYGDTGRRQGNRETVGRETRKNMQTTEILWASGYSGNHEGKVGRHRETYGDGTETTQVRVDGWPVLGRDEEHGKAMGK